MTEEQLNMLKELLDVSKGLTAWEADFVDDLSHRDETEPLSDKQATKLAQIWERVFS